MAKVKDLETLRAEILELIENRKIHRNRRTVGESRAALNYLNALIAGEQSRIHNYEDEVCHHLREAGKNAEHLLRYIVD